MPKNKKYKEITRVEMPIEYELSTTPMDKVLLHLPAVFMTGLLGVVAYNLYQADNLLWLTITVTILFIISREVMIFELKRVADALARLGEQLIKMYHYWSDEALKNKAEIARRDMKDGDRK